jgi:glycosyltransferase involved in cell wall biosynthesis
MRVAFVASTLRLGGAERITGELSERLRERGFDARWFLLREPGREGERLIARGVPVTAGLGRFRFDPLVPLRLGRRLREFGADAAWCLDHQNAAVGLAGAASSAGLERLYLAVHTTGLWGGGSSLPPALRTVLPRFTKIVAVAEGQKRHLVDRDRVPADRVVVVRNGVDLERFGATPERLAAGVRLHAGILGSLNGPLVGVVAALRPEKGHVVLLDALSLLHARYRDLHLVLIGEGPERPALEDAVRARSLESAVTFLGARDDIPELLQALDIVVLPSLPAVETLPLAILEAMAAGRAVVATRVGSLDEVVEDDRTGLLVPTNDAGALAAALERLATFADLRERLAAGALVAARRFDIEDTVTRVAALLRGEGAPA